VFVSLWLAVFFPLTLAASPGFDQKAADIVEKMIEAQGGREVLNGIRDATLVGSVDWEKMTGRVTIYRKEPNQFRQDLEIMKMIKTDAFDGETAFRDGGVGDREIHHHQGDFQHGLGGFPVQDSKITQGWFMDKLLQPRRGRYYSENKYFAAEAKKKRLIPNQ
jgi:hypothetical protein